MLPHALRFAALSLASLLAFADTGQADESTKSQPATPARSVETLKERLSDKASDEQRVDNCHVPPELRAASVRVQRQWRALDGNR